jgi:hypothetical protein
MRQVVNELSRKTEGKQKPSSMQSWDPQYAASSFRDQRVFRHADKALSSSGLSFALYGKPQATREQVEKLLS